MTGFAAGDEVIGFTDNRASQAEYVVVEAANLTAKPAGCPGRWPGRCSWPGPRPTPWCARWPDRGDTVVVSGAAGGVGSIAVQLAQRAGATVIGLASEAHHDWLPRTGLSRSATATGWPTGSGRRPTRWTRSSTPTAADYVQLALDLGVQPTRVDTIVNFEAVGSTGSRPRATPRAPAPSVLAELAGLIAAGELEIPIAATFPLDQVQDAYRRLEGHIRGKIVLLP